MMKSIRFWVCALILGAICFAGGAQTPKYIFYFIGDGMGIAHVTNTQLYNWRVLKNETPLLFTTFPVVSMSTTHSASSDVTDSAAAGTALATGHKTNNGMLGMSADTVAVNSIAIKLQEEGYGIGLVTSVAIDDATPGAFYAHVPNRNQFYDIGLQLAASGFQFAAGASLRGTRDKDGKENDLMQAFEQQNVSVHYGLDSIDTTADRLLILSPFHKEQPNEIGYAIDARPGAMTLSALTREAVNHLMRVSPERFFLMVEGGSIDHAGHGNDGGTAIHEVMAFNEALKVVYDFYLQHPDETLILVTADHETGGMSVGNQTTGYSVQLDKIAGQKMSKDEFGSLCRTIIKSRGYFTWDDMLAMMRENLGVGETVTFSESELDELHTMFEDVFKKREAGLDQKTLYSTFDGFTNSVFNKLNAKAGIGWTSGGHTGMPVPVYAIGAGAQRFSTLNDNTQLSQKILQK